MVLLKIYFCSLCLYICMCSIHSKQKNFKFEVSTVCIVSSNPTRFTNELSSHGIKNRNIIFIYTCRMQYLVN